METAELPQGLHQRLHFYMGKLAIDLGIALPARISAAPKSHLIFNFTSNILLLKHFKCEDS